MSNTQKLSIPEGQSKVLRFSRTTTSDDADGVTFDTRVAGQATGAAHLSVVTDVPKIDFFTCTFEELANEYVPSGREADEGWTREITLTDGTVVPIRCIGVYHDDLPSGGKAKLTFEFASVVVIRAMNTAQSTTGGYPNSETASYIAGDFEKLLPNALRSVITPIKKLNRIDKSSSAIENIYRIWLHSAVEVFGPNASGVYADEGEWYAYYSQNNTPAQRVKKGTLNNSANPRTWWLRSVYSTQMFMIVNSAGYLYQQRCDFSNSNTTGIAPGFCIGEGGGQSNLTLLVIFLEEVAGYGQLAA